MDDDDTRMSDALEGYRVLGEELVTKWGDLGAGIAAKIDADEYDSEAMLDAWAKTMRLSAQTSFLMWSEALDAGAILSGSQYAPDIVHFDAYSPLPGASLEPEGHFVGEKTGAELPSVKVRPSQLADGETKFTVYADATGLPKDIYWGNVRAWSGVDVEPVEVHLAVS